MLLTEVLRTRYGEGVSPATRNEPGANLVGVCAIQACHNLYDQRNRLCICGAVIQNRNFLPDGAVFGTPLAAADQVVDVSFVLLLVQHAGIHLRSITGIVFGRLYTPTGYRLNHRSSTSEHCPVGYSWIGS